VACVVHCLTPLVNGRVVGVKARQLLQSHRHMFPRVNYLTQRLRKRVAARLSLIGRDFFEGAAPPSELKGGHARIVPHVVVWHFCDV
jgi:hypothetical protein